MLEFFDEIKDFLFDNRRVEGYKHFARTQGFDFKKKVSPDVLPSELKKMDYFNGKKKLLIKGFIYKSIEPHPVNLHIYDLVNRREIGSKTTTSFLYYCPELKLPQFSIKPRGGISKIGSIFTGTEWAEYHPEFDKEFIVSSQNMNYLRMAMTTQFTDVMLNIKNYIVEGLGNYMLIYRPNHITDIIHMDNVYEAGLELIDIILTDYSK